MEFVFLAHRIPFPPDRGDKIRSFHLLRELGRHGRVHLACFADDAADAAHLPALREAMGASLGEAYVEVRGRNWLSAAAALLGGRPLLPALFESRDIRAFVQRLLAERPIDALVAFSCQMAQFVPDPCGARFVMDFADMDSAKYAAYGAAGGGPLAWLHRREGRALLDFEREVAQRADASLFVSGAEAALFRQSSGLASAPISVLENGIDLRFYDPAGDFSPIGAEERGQGPLIVFTGQMDYRPNVEAVTSFAKAVMPLIRREAPDACFAIVGRSPTAAVRRLDGQDGTRVIGAVADVRSWLAAADAVVAPLLIARGIQNKLLEAMAMAKPTIASPAAFEGIDAVAGRDLIVAESPADQAQAVLDLLGDPVQAAALGAAGRRRMEVVYSWPAKLAPLVDLLGLPKKQAAA